MPNVAQTIPMSKGTEAVSVLTPLRYAFSRRSRPIPSRIRPEMRRAIGGMFRPKSAAVILGGRFQVRPMGSGAKSYSAAGIAGMRPAGARRGGGPDGLG